MASCTMYISALFVFTALCQGEDAAPKKPTMVRQRKRNPTVMTVDVGAETTSESLASLDSKPIVATGTHDSMAVMVDQNGDAVLPSEEDQEEQSPPKLEQTRMVRRRADKTKEDSMVAKAVKVMAGAAASLASGATSGEAASLASDAEGDETSGSDTKDGVKRMVRRRAKTDKATQAVQDSSVTAASVQEGSVAAASANDEALSRSVLETKVDQLQHMVADRDHEIELLQQKLHSADVDVSTEAEQLLELSGSISVMQKSDDYLQSQQKESDAKANTNATDGGKRMVRRRAKTDKAEQSKDAETAETNRMVRRRKLEDKKGETAETKIVANATDMPTRMVRRKKLEEKKEDKAEQSKDAATDMPTRMVRRKKSEEKKQ